MDQALYRGDVSEHRRRVVRAAASSDRREAESFVADSEVLLPRILADPHAAEQLPLVWSRLRAHGLENEVPPEWAARYRLTLATNQTVIAEFGRAIDEVATVTADALVLKGGAIVSSAYLDDTGVRTLADIDLLVDDAAVEAIVDRLVAAGWQHGDFRVRDRIPFKHSVDMWRGDSGGLDLHWELLANGRDRHRNHELFASAEGATLGGLPIKVPSPTVHLFHSLNHLKPSGMRHLTDALVVIEIRGDDIDWDLLVDEAAVRRVLETTRFSAELVNRIVPDAIPPPVIRDLERRPRHWTDRRFVPLERHRDVPLRAVIDFHRRSRNASLGDKLAVLTSQCRVIARQGLSGLRPR